AAWQLMKALAISEKQNLEQFVTLQPYYSLVSRETELELIPLCLDQGLGIIPWSPLAGGFLSGKYRRGNPFPQNTRFTNSQYRFLQFDDDHAYTIIDELEKIAQAHNASIAQAALNYILRKPGVSSIIIGARTPEQLADNLKTTDWIMTSDEVMRLDKLSEPPRLYPYWMLEFTKGDRT
ncbi:MAG: aldo/keto reductase, partial [Ignavibacteriales bacterium]|nr:aldo/keto reductase [Ignavibacteriales bacterium]